MFRSAVKPDGKLNQAVIHRKENIYLGMNGRYVERFYLNPTESYIYKPLTNEAQMGKEVWMYHHLLLNLPPIFPKIVAYSIDESSDQNWIIFEDLGAIQHQFNKELAVNVINLMTAWHSLPPEILINHSLKGPKPPIEEIVEFLFLNKNKVEDVIAQHHIPDQLLNTIFTMLDRHEFPNKQVISHGDLHQGNYGMAGERVVILDWEHAHVNSPYWDLYHLLDISHPDFSKELNKEWRNQLLDHYLDKMNFPSKMKLRFHFKQMYYLFSAAFSIWMLLLIQNDLEKNAAKWSKERLTRQKTETISNLIQCGEELDEEKLNKFTKEEEVYL
ncbi:phosphotransferase [Cytobacillus depressus]|uniref:Phosphotransferase n=1 Tax=Cytobacillus depressus TaxID=1602942 RepID=A0A6L3VA63_9BACI|nr:phosphotransferase [Cytobacillus depressus]KAB2338052.1 phosphotransferase [Cytobacillus depressus]